MLRGWAPAPAPDASRVALSLRSLGPRRVLSALWQRLSAPRPAPLRVAFEEASLEGSTHNPPRPSSPALSSLDRAACSYMSYEEEFFVHDASVPPVLREVKRLSALKRVLPATASPADKVATLLSVDRVVDFLSSERGLDIGSILDSLPHEDQYVLLCLPAIGQPHVLQAAEKQGAANSDLRSCLCRLAEKLRLIEGFYDSIGGIVGYQLKSLELIAAGMEGLREEQQALGSQAQHAAAPSSSSSSSSDSDSCSPTGTKRFLVPKAVDLAAEDGREVAREASARGLRSMPQLAEIYPVGGAGDRLGLIDEGSGECLPAAMLPYCGRTMLENLIRDLQAREFLYFRLTGRQLTTPVAIMTSDAKGNNRRITQLMESLGWFGRGRDAFRLFRQPLVPVLSVETGEWLLSAPMAPMMKPGGHGAIWKLMRDEGVFDWLSQQGRSAALVRQISNPMAGMDTTLLALAGVGSARRASFGFMSCDRHVGAAEGVNVLQEHATVRDGRPAFEYNLTNIEYTEFDRLGITDEAVEGAPGAAQLSVFPANTNVLYVGLKAAQAIVEEAIATGSSERLMPGLIFNLKKKVSYTDPLAKGHQERKVQAGRMECTMQNIADYMTDSFDKAMSPAEVAAAQLSTFLVYNHRRKVTSSAKKRREPGSTRISQTPDGSFYDLQRNAWHLLQQCGVKHVPELGSIEQYLANGPGFIFLYHPALGPLWDVISHKIQGGALLQGSELVLEVAEARLQNLVLQGSLLVYAESVVGHMQGPLTVHGLQFGEEGVQMRARVPNELARRSFSSVSFGAEATCCEEKDGVARQRRTASLAQEDERMVYSSRVGRISLVNVCVRNEGIDWSHRENLYWKHQVQRREAARVVLNGQSEFEARDVVISGDHTFSVPDGFRMVVSQGAMGSIVTTLLPLEGGQPSWEWAYSMSDSGAVSLELVHNAAAERALMARQALAVGATAGSVGQGYDAAMELGWSWAAAGGLVEEDQEFLMDYIIQDVSSWII